MLAFLLLACTQVPTRDPLSPPDDTVSAAEDSVPLEEEVVLPGGLVQHGVQTCAVPSARETLGPFLEPTLGAAWAAQVPAGRDPETLSRGAGLAVADVDGDGRLDILLTARSPCMLFVQQADGTFADESAARLPDAAADCAAWGASVADLEGDGDVDLLLLRDGATNRILSNDGTGHFSAVALGTEACGSRSASWGDYDRDGDLDLFVANHHALPGSLGCADPKQPSGEPNFLYENRGTEGFVDVSAVLPAAGVGGFTFLGSWLDADNDQDADLYVVNDFGQSAGGNVLLHNDGAGAFTVDAGDGTGLNTEAMGLGIGDLNGDQIADLLVADNRKLHLLLSAGGIWYDAAVSLGLVPVQTRGQRTGWGAELADIDNNGLLDAVVVFGPTEVAFDDPLEGQQPDGLWLQGADGHFTDVAEDWGIADVQVGRGLAVVDLDGDGWLDLVKPDYRGGPTQVWQARCGEAAWLAIRLQAPAPNTHAIGAVVDVTVDGVDRRRWALAGSTSLATGVLAPLHFGLGDADHIDQLVVTWPDGSQSRYTDLPTRQAVTLIHPDLLR